MAKSRAGSDRNSSCLGNLLRCIPKSSRTKHQESDEQEDQDESRESSGIRNKLKPARRKRFSFFRRRISTKQEAAPGGVSHLNTKHENAPGVLDLNTKQEASPGGVSHLNAKQEASPGRVSHQNTKQEDSPGGVSHLNTKQEASPNVSHVDTKQEATPDTSPSYLNTNPTSQLTPSYQVIKNSAVEENSNIPLVHVGAKTESRFIDEIYNSPGLDLPLQLLVNNDGVLKEKDRSRCEDEITKIEEPNVDKEPEEFHKRLQGASQSNNANISNHNGRPFDFRSCIAAGDNAGENNTAAEIIQNDVTPQFPYVESTAARKEQLDLPQFLQEESIEKCVDDEVISEQSVEKCVDDKVISLDDPRYSVVVDSNKLENVAASDIHSAVFNEDKTSQSNFRRPSMPSSNDTRKKLKIQEQGKQLQSLSSSGVDNHGLVSQTHQPKGLVNMGNTCYYNSVLQNLYQTYELETQLKAFSQKTFSLTESCVPLTKAVLSFYASMSSSSSRSPVQPSKLLHELSKRTTRFVGSSQQDSHELLRHLLDGLKEEEKIIITKETEDQTKEFDIGRHLTTTVDRVFGGRFMTVYWCDLCGHPHHLCETFLDISLPIKFDMNVTDFTQKLISSASVKQSDITADEKDLNSAIVSMMSRLKNSQTDQKIVNTAMEGERYNSDKMNERNLEMTVENCLEYLTRVEELEEEYLCLACLARWRSSEGKLDHVVSNEYQLTTARKQMLIFSPPEILTLNLQRFEEDYNGFKKVNDFIKFSLHLDLAPYCSSWSRKANDQKLPSINYSLYGLVVHGGSLAGGHYVAYVKARRPAAHSTGYTAHSTGYRNDPHIMAVKAQLQLENNSIVETGDMTGEWLVKEMKNRQNLGIERHCEDNEKKDEVFSEDCKQIKDYVSEDLEANPEQNLQNDLEASPEQNSDSWFYISDSLVRSCDVHEVQRQQAFILFYKRLNFV